MVLDAFSGAMRASWRDAAAEATHLGRLFIETRLIYTLQHEQ